MNLVDVRKGKTEVTRSLQLAPQKSTTLSTLYEIMWGFLHSDFLICTWKEGNSDLKWRVSSEDVPRWLTSQNQLEESPRMKTVCLFFLYEFSRFWLRYTEHSRISFVLLVGICLRVLYVYVLLEKCLMNSRRPCKAPLDSSDISHTVDAS